MQVVVCNQEKGNGTMFESIYALVRTVPRGKVVTYGQVAHAIPGCNARVVGYAMAGTPEHSRVPWQRVVNAKGEISKRSWRDGGKTQREILEEEGVRFDLKNRVDLAAYRWQFPEEETSIE